MIALRVVPAALARRVTAGALALSLVARALPVHADVGTSESKVGVLMAVLCGFALRLAIPAPVPWAGVAAGSCAFAFIDAATSPDNPPSDPPPKP